MKRKESKHHPGRLRAIILQLSVNGPMTTEELEAALCWGLDSMRKVVERAWHDSKMIEPAIEPAPRDRKYWALTDAGRDRARQYGENPNRLVMNHPEAITTQQPLFPIVKAPAKIIRRKAS